jgi:Winged helix-turn helix
MRTGVTLSVTSADLDRLRVLVKDRNAPQKHVWRAQILLLSAEGVCTNAIMRETGRSKTYVWRWQERFASEGVKGLLRDKTRPSRIPKLAPSGRINQSLRLRGEIGAAGVGGVEASI